MERISVEWFGLEADIRFAGSLLFVVLFHPGGEAFAGGSVAPAERQRSNLAVGHRNFVPTVLGHHASEAIREPRAVHPAVEEIAFNFLAAFERDGQITAIVESLFQ